MAEVAKHNKKGDCWVVIHDKVYDLSNFDHPGGNEPIIANAGLDRTDAFEDAGHGISAKNMMKKYVIGTLVQPPTEEKTSHCKCAML